MSDSNKTKKELLKEIEALRARLDEKEAPELPSEPHRGISRREILASAWVAPVILSVPLAGGIGLSHKAHAQTPTVPVPTLSPTILATSSPTALLPTLSPTLRPTQSPTILATSSPTVAAPTAFPTAVPGVIPVEVSEYEIS